MEPSAADARRDPFAGSRERFDALKTLLAEEQAAHWDQARLEEELQTGGRALLGQLKQDRLALQALREADQADRDS